VAGRPAQIYIQLLPLAAFLTVEGITRMARNPERKFDWAEFLAVDACGADVGILPDVLEPAVHPHHRGFFHSIAFVLLVIWALAKFGATLTGLTLGFYTILACCYFSHSVLGLFDTALPASGRADGAAGK